MSDAVPKKRGPKTDVLEALLKRVDGLEKQLHKEKKGNTPDQVDQSPPDAADASSSTSSDEGLCSPHTEHSCSGSCRALKRDSHSVSTALGACFGS